MSVLAARADARQLPLADNCADAVITSVPYWGLRDYGFDEQIGNEATVSEWLANLLDCTRDWMRVVKPTGSIFVNCGDKTSDRGHGPNRGRGTGRGPQATGLPQTRGPMEKSLLGLPWRYAIACMDELGLILRAEIIWWKTDPMPDSAKDRVGRIHEHLFHFVMQPRYYEAADTIREPHKRLWTPGRNGGRNGWDRGDHLNANLHTAAPHSLGRIPGSVWEFATTQLKVPPYTLLSPEGLRWVTTEPEAWEWARYSGITSSRYPRDDSHRPELRATPQHFAAFPYELPRRCILGWTPPGICLECGEGRRPVVEREQEWTGRTNSGRAKRQTAGDDGGARGFNSAGYKHTISHTRITGYTCACPAPTAPTRPALVVDPCGGTGTTGLVASVLGRRSIVLDRSGDYCWLAAWRTTDPGERTRALGAPKPASVPVSQATLFGAAS